jgi:hypothetical protein
MTKKGKGKGPGENRALHNAAELARQSALGCLGTVYRLISPDVVEGLSEAAPAEILAALVYSAEHSLACVQQIAQLATGRTRRDIEALAEDLNGKLALAMETLVDGGWLPPPGDMF